MIRRGRVVGSRRPADTSEGELAELMVGHAVKLQVDRGISKPGATVLVVEGLRAADDRGHETLRGVDLEVRAGEIHGIAGVAGNGQDELVEAIAGLRKILAGRVGLDGHDLTGASPRRMHEAGVSYVPADRQRVGLVLPFTVADNLVLTRYFEPPFATGPGRILRDPVEIERHARVLVQEFDIRTPSPTVPAATLSGGNQQKVVVAREFRETLRLLILDQPTRGLDVGSVEFIHRRVIAARDAGVAILLVSAELDEVLELADRVSVLFRGRLVATLDAREAQREVCGMLMAKGAA